MCTLCLGHITGVPFLTAGNQKNPPQDHPSCLACCAVAVVFFPALYLAMYSYYLWAATKYVHSVPWADYRIANLMVRLHVRTSPHP